jgi:hypothetical protein
MKKINKEDTKTTIIRKRARSELDNSVENYNDYNYFQFR